MLKTIGTVSTIQWQLQFVRKYTGWCTVGGMLRGNFAHALR